MAGVITLAIEASTYVGSAALLVDGLLAAERTVAMRGREHEALMPAVAELLGTGGTAGRPPDRIVCGAGPGAFTSLRIAGGIAKGLALALGVPLFAVPSLALVVAADPLPPGRYLVAVDAMRGDQYVQRFVIDAEGAIAVEDAAALLPTARLDEARGTAMVLGPGQPGERRRDPHARGVARLAALLHGAEPVDLAGWEPAYGRLAEAQVKWEAAHGRPLSLA